MLLSAFQDPYNVKQLGNLRAVERFGCFLKLMFFLKLFRRDVVEFNCLSGSLREKLERKDATDPI